VKTVLTELRSLDEAMSCFFRAASELAGDFSDGCLRGFGEMLVRSIHGGAPLLMRVNFE
jgi:hypothetical protein